MMPPIDDDDELNGAATERAEDESSGEEGKKGKSGGTSGGGAKLSSNEEEHERKVEDTGEGDSDSFGRGKAGAASGVAKISPQKLKEVMADWRHLDVTAVVEAVAEFFSELPMRASANLSVTWEKTKSNVKSFAIVNWMIEFGENTVRELARTRERTRGAGRDSRGVQRQTTKKRGPGFGMTPGPAGPTGAQ